MCTVLAVVKAILSEQEDSDSYNVADRLVERFRRCSTSQKQRIFAELHRQLGTVITSFMFSPSRPF